MEGCRLGGLRNIMDPTSNRMMMGASIPPGPPPATSVSLPFWQYDSNNPASLTFSGYPGGFLAGDVIVVIEARENNSETVAPTAAYISGYTGLTSTEISTFTGSGFYAMSIAAQYRRLTSATSSITINGAMSGDRNGYLIAAMIRGNNPITTINVRSTAGTGTWNNYWQYGSSGNIALDTNVNLLTAPAMAFSIYFAGSGAQTGQRTTGQAFSSDSGGTSFVASTEDISFDFNMISQFSYVTFNATPSTLYALSNSIIGLRGILHGSLSFS